MSAEVFVCSGCGKEAARNGRLAAGVQRYCRAQRCQRKRRAQWQRQKLRNDEKYRHDQAATDRDWHAKRPDYYREYRQARPQLVAQNRLKQRLRDRRRRPRCSGARVSGPVATAGVTGPDTAAHVADGHYLLLSLDVPRARAFDVYVSRACKDGRVPDP